MTLSQVGRYIGPYELQEEIGRGGMSRVYRAFDPTMDREVAVKVLTSVVAQDEEYQRRFRREINTACELEHPFILPVYDYGRDENALFLVMPYVQRGTLSDIIKDHRTLTPAQAAIVARQIGEALDYAHARQIVHRDIKPHNIMVIDDDRFCLSDFGLVKLGNESTQLTFTGILLGSPAYMSPEQAGSGPVDHRSDIYSLGIVLYEALLGRRPFNGETPIELITHHLTAHPIRPSWINPNFPRPLERVLMRALEKKSNDRYASAGELADAFCSTVDEMPEEIRTAPLVSSQQMEASLNLVNEPLTVVLPPAISSRRRLFPWALITLLLVALCGTVFALNSLVIHPLREQVDSVEQTAQALRDGAPVVVTQIVVNEAGVSQIIYVTVIPTQIPLADRLMLNQTPTPASTGGPYVAPTPTAAPLNFPQPPPLPDLSGGGSSNAGSSGSGNGNGNANTHDKNNK